jgi:hypothetical protein
MIRGIVNFTMGTDPLMAVLHDEGWSCRGLEVIGEILNGEFNPHEYGPALGDPFHQALAEAAEFLVGTFIDFQPKRVEKRERIY